MFDQAYFKGKDGEYDVTREALRYLDKEDYHLYNNVTLSDGEGTTQIDHIIISKYGVFVIETKNYQGWIFGKKHHRKWTVSHFGKKYTFQNPIRQNFKHVKVVEKLLAIEADKIFSVIVFAGNCSIKTEMPDNVRYLDDYIRYIESKREVLLADQEVKISKWQVETNRLENSEKTDRGHVEYLKRVHGEAKEEVGPEVTFGDIKIPSKSQNPWEQFLVPEEELKRTLKVFWRDLQSPGALYALIAVALVLSFIFFEPHKKKKLESTIRYQASYPKVETKSYQPRTEASKVTHTREVVFNDPVHITSPTKKRMSRNPGRSTIYKWTDENGKVHYSNVSVPAGYKAEMLEPRGYKFE